MRGLEPPRLSSQEPKSCVSTNFTTSACGIYFHPNIKKHQRQQITMQMKTLHIKETEGYQRKMQCRHKNDTTFIKS